MALTLKQYWTTLQDALIKFDQTNTVKAANEHDQQGYQKQREFLNKMVKHGLSVEKASWLVTKMPDGLCLQSLPGETWGKENLVVTTFYGPLSVTFAETIYLPHLRRFNEVTIEDQIASVRAFCKLPEQKEAALVLVNTLATAIENYKAKTPSPLIANSQFRPNAQHASAAPNESCEASSSLQNA